MVIPFFTIHSMPAGEREREAVSELGITRKGIENKIAHNIVAVIQIYGVAATEILCTGLIVSSQKSFSEC